MLIALGHRAVRPAQRYSPRLCRTRDASPGRRRNRKSELLSSVRPADWQHPVPGRRDEARREQRWKAEPRGRRPKARTCGNGEDSEMRVLLATWGSRGDVEPLVGLAVALRGLGAEARVCAPPDDEFAKLLERVSVPLVPLGPTVRSVVAGTKPPTAEDASRLASELVAAGFDTLGAAAEGCDVLLANGMMATAGARGAADRLGMPYVYACYHTPGLPPRHFPCRGRGGGRAVSAGRDRQGAVGAGPEGERQFLRGAQRPSGGDRLAAGGRLPRLRLHRPAGRGWLRTRRCARRRAGRISTSCRPGRGSCPTTARSRKGWRRSWTPARHRCTWASAAWPRTPRGTSPGWPSRPPGRRAVGSCSPAAGPSWPRATTRMTASSSSLS